MGMKPMNNRAPSEAVADSVSIFEAPRTKGVDSARRVLQILLQFSQSNPRLTLDDLLEAYDISVPSAYRYISLLREMNLIEEREKGVFFLSPEILRLAQAAEASFDYHADLQIILDRLRDETSETALFLRRFNDSAMCVAIAQSDHPIGISFQPGSPMPLHSGASAKVLFAEYSAAKRAQYLDRLRPALDDAERAALEADLDRIRESGYAESLAEVDEGVCATAAAVRLHGTLVGAITIAAPAYRLGEERRAEMSTAVRSAAAELERILTRRR